MVIYILLIIIVILFTVSMGVILMHRDSGELVSNEKMTDDVSVLLEDNVIDDSEII